MKIIAIFIVFFSLSCMSLTDDTPKVKIGIKQRAINCTKKAKKGDVVHVHYKGRLKDGTEFDSSYKRNIPFPFELGANQVIKGWEQGLKGICVGEQRRLIIPPELGYGKTGAGNQIPPNSVLIFDIELIKIDKPNGEL